MPKPDVTICIPTWQAEPFIERTLNCARAQTHDKIRILVSVDRCDDGTEAVCRKHAAQDSRIDVRVQPERLGWSGNSNFLLDQVDTEFYFLYFHDDIIEPTYAERLRQVLIDHPEVQSVNCDLAHFGDREGIIVGGNYEGQPAQRLIRLLVGPERGALLRSLCRSGLLAKGLRFPLIAGDGFWRLQPFLMGLVAAGPARRVPEVLYRRWVREGSLTKTWDPDGQDALADGQQQSAALCLGTIQNLNLSQAEYELVKFCLFISMMTRTRRYEHRLKVGQLVKPEFISEAFRTARLPKDSSVLEPQTLNWVLNAYAALLSLEGKHATQQGNHELALASFAAALSLNPGLRGHHASVARGLEANGLKQSAAAVRQRLRLLKGEGP
jgi:glycosyltransferase involved in cell wall biosynthesis